MSEMRCGNHLGRNFSRQSQRLIESDLRFGLSFSLSTRDSNDFSCESLPEEQRVFSLTDLELDPLPFGRPITPPCAPLAKEFQNPADHGH